MKRIGVFAGTFDPIHLGHTAFIEQAIQAHRLDRVLLLIEKTPRFKSCLATYEQRLVMVKLAIAANSKIQIYATDCQDFPISNCLPHIRVNNPDAKLYLLLGDDVARHIKTWPDAEQLLQGVELIIGDRQPDAPSSLKVRSSLKTSAQTIALDPAVNHYILQHNLYK